MSDPEDLEDGEIEDDEDDVVQPVDPPLIQPTPEDYREYETQQQQAPSLPSGDHHHHPGGSGGEEKPVPNRENANHVNNKSQRSSKKPTPVVDDWATKVENAIANALKRDGVQPPMPSSVPHTNDPEGDTPSGSSNRRSKKRKKANRNADGHNNKQPRLGGGDQDADDGMELDLEYEMMNVRGSSPQHVMGRDSGRSDSEADDTHYSSDDSSMRDRDGHGRGGAGGGNNSRRDREQRDRDRERERDRERDRDYNRKKRKQSRQRSNNNKPNRDGGRKRKRDDSDDEKYRPTGPRKMELCKFYLMDCCAKREKCLYMHKDFPCKYYYLGMKCKEKDKCLFSHGEPLSDDLRAILLKHLETAPQEILGSFQRISRDNAINMLNATHRKLQERYGGKGDPSSGGKIPSLLDVVTGHPPTSSSGGGTAGGSMLSPKHSRRSRWCGERQGGGEGGEGSDGEPSDGGDMTMQLAGVITPAQISDLEQMGIRTLDEISQLTVAQLNELGLSITQIHDLQVRALHALRMADERRRPTAAAPEPTKDLDLRTLPGAATGAAAAESIGSNTNDQDGSSSSRKDVDMRVLPLGEPPSDKVGTSTIANHDDGLPPPGSGVLLKPPTVDYSQYIKDSNLDEEDLDAVAANSSCLLNAPEEDDDDDDDDEENNLKITFDEEEEEERKESDENDPSESEKQQGVEENREADMLLPPLIPPKIDYAQGLGDILKFGSSTIDKSLHQGNSNESPRSHRSPSPVAKDEQQPDVWTPSMADTQSNSNSGGHQHQQLYGAGGPAQVPKPAAKANTIKRSASNSGSIYDWYDSDNASEDGGRGSPTMAPAPFRYGSSDKPLPLNIADDDPYSIGGSSIGGREPASELSFPFKSMMANYVPATEIDGSIGSHAPIHYKVYVVDVPKPNYATLRRSMARPVGTKDPRLRRLFGLQSDDDEDRDDTSDGIKSPDPNPNNSPLHIGSPSMNPPLHPPAVSKPPASIISSGPRVDPRKRHAEKLQQEAAAAAAAAATHQTTGGGPFKNNSSMPQIDVQAILQKSAWYKDLGSQHKIMVNQQLAILSTEMKKFHNSDRSPEHLSDFMKFLSTSNMLQQILTYLNVYVDDSVTFCEVQAVPNLPPPALPMSTNIPPPTIGGPPLPSMQLPIPLHVPPPIGVMPGPMSVPPPHQPPVYLGGPKGGPFGQQDPQSGPPPPAGMMRPGLLGVSPNMPFEQFLAMGNVNKNDIGGGGGGVGGGGLIPPWVQGNGNNMRNMRNNNRIGHNFRNNNDRWGNNNNNGGGGGQQMMIDNNGNNPGGQGNNINRRNNGNNNNNNRRMNRKK